MQFSPYLNFDGQCKEAFTFYQQVLGGTIEMMQTHGDSPIAGEVPAEWQGRILHARLVVGNAVLMASDLPPEYHARPEGFAVALQVNTPPEAERVFHALAENGTITMPVDKTFWAERFGMLTDRFGTPWMVSCDRPA